MVAGRQNGRCQLKFHELRSVLGALGNFLNWTCIFAQALPQDTDWVGPSRRQTVDDSSLDTLGRKLIDNIKIRTRVEI